MATMALLLEAFGGRNDGGRRLIRKAVQAAMWLPFATFSLEELGIRTRRGDLEPLMEIFRRGRARTI